MGYTEWEQTTFANLKTQVETKKGELKIEEGKVKRAQEFVQQKEAKLKELTDLEKKFQETASKFPRSSSLPELIKTLSGISDKVQLGFSRFKPLAEERRDLFVDTPIEVQMRGSYVQIMSFFDAISNLPRVIVTDKLMLSDPRPRGTISELTAEATIKTVHLDVNGGG